jgi:hypothetical protein
MVKTITTLLMGLVIGGFMLTSAMTLFQLTGVQKDQDTTALGEVPKLITTNGSVTTQTELFAQLKSDELQTGTGTPFLKSIPSALSKMTTALAGTTDTISQTAEILHLPGPVVVFLGLVLVITLVVGIMRFFGGGGPP